MSCKIEITQSNGEKVTFFAQGLTYTAHQEMREVYIFGKYDAEQLLPGIMTVNMICSGVRFFGEPKKKLDDLIPGGICTQHSMAISALRNRNEVKPKHRSRRRSAGRRNRPND
jgi:hypothetical protein